MNIFERQKDFLSFIEKLDISPALFENAKGKYEALASFLNEHGVNASIYPQGSFALGTVIRPMKKDRNPSYDLDFICHVEGNKSDYTPSGLRNIIEEALKSSDTYGGKLVKWEECFTIEYAEVNGISFSIDIVPAVDESKDNITNLICKGLHPNNANTSVAIPRQSSENGYRWISNNPKGFKSWFDEINMPFLIYARENNRRKIFENNRAIFASVEEIPQELERSSLQRVIQILKYQRDSYYSKVKCGDDIKPISALITTVVTRIANQYHHDCSVFELLEFVLSKLELCVHQKHYTFEEFSSRYDNAPVISFKGQKWSVPNPADPDDNLADKWNNDDRISTTFFKWITIMKQDLIVSLSQDDDTQFGIILENSFGAWDDRSAVIKKYRGSQIATPIISSTAAKPYICQ